MSLENTLLEAETREVIDQKLISAGWVVQNIIRINLYESIGVAHLEKMVLAPFNVGMK